MIENPIAGEEMIDINRSEELDEHNKIMYMGNNTNYTQQIDGSDVDPTAFGTTDTIAHQVDRKDDHGNSN